MMKKEFRLKRNGKVVVIIDEENSLLAKIIKYSINFLPSPNLEKYSICLFINFSFNGI